MKKALEEVDNSDTPNITAIAKKHNLYPSTLNRRVRGVTVSRQERASNDQKLLTDPQEETLLKQLNWLSDRGLHATVRIVRNMVEEFLGHPIGRTWVYRFLERYKGRYTSVYLKGFDRERKIADNAAHIAHFYTNVSLLILIELSKILILK